MCFSKVEDILLLGFILELELFKASCNYGTMSDKFLRESRLTDAPYFLLTKASNSRDCCKLSSSCVTVSFGPSFVSKVVTSSLCPALI
jgi:hypothetical protein